MANADFSKQDTAPGGFNRDSYRKEEKNRAAALTPAQQKLAKAEKALPAGLRNQAVAAVLVAVVIAVSVFGVNGAKLSSSYKKAKNAFANGVAADVQSGDQYTMLAQLKTRAGAANNVIVAASGFTGVNQDIIAQAKAALDQLNAALQEGMGPEALYDADTALDAAISLLHADVQAHAPEALQTGAEQSAFSQFASAGTTMNHLSYNDVAQEFNNKVGKVPANLIGGLWGCRKVELFA